MTGNGLCLNLSWLSFRSLVVSPNLTASNDESVQTLIFGCMQVCAMGQGANRFLHLA